MNITQIQTKIKNFIALLIILLPALMPIFFLPLTTEFYEFNKLALLMVSVAVMLVGWAIRVILTSRLSIAKSKLDMPMLAMTAVFVLSSIFSRDKVSSIFGSQGRWFPSLVGTLTLVVFYYVLTSTIDNVKTIKAALHGLIGSTTIASLVGVLSYFGVHFGKAEFLKTAAFNPTGSTSTITIIALISTVLAYALFRQSTSRKTSIFLAATIAINFLMLLISGTTPVWISLVTAVLFITIFVAPKTEKVLHLALMGTLAGLVILSVFPATRKVIMKSQYAKEVKPSSVESWIVASSTVRDYPLLGTGPSTFFLNFPRYRSTALNGTDYWNTRFDKPYSEVFGIISCLGIIGTAATAYFVVKAWKYGWENRNKNELSIILATGLFVSMTAFLFSYATVLTSFVFFLLLGLLVANTNVEMQKAVGSSVYLNWEGRKTNTIGSMDTTNTAILRIIMASPLVALAVFGIIYLLRMYPGEYFMRKAIVSANNGDGARAYEYQTRAIIASPARVSYRNSYAQTNISLVRAMAAEENLTDTDKQTIQTLISQALQNTQIATETLSPLDVNSWEARAEIYAALIGAAENADQWAIASLQNAIELDPNNPSLRVSLGSIYYANEDYLTAANMFKQATTLKGDYANAYYNLALSLKNLEDYTNAKEAFKITQNLVEKDSEDYNVLAEEISALEALTATAEEEKPTVEELAQPENQDTTQQEPITNVGEETKQEVVTTE